MVADVDRWPIMNTGSRTYAVYLLSKALKVLRTKHTHDDYIHARLCFEVLVLGDLCGSWHEKGQWV